MVKICCIFNMPSLYRETIYTMIDKEYDCDWYFDNEKTDISLFDVGKLRNVHILKYKKLVSRFYVMDGLLSMVLKRQNYNKYLMIGSPLCISLWGLCIWLKIFCPQKEVYFWTHGWYGKERFFERIVKKLFLNLADKILVYGNYAKELMIKEGFSPNKIFVIHNSLSYDTQLELRKEMKNTSIYFDHFGNKNPILIFIGRLTSVKRLDMLIQAVSDLKDNKFMCNLIFVGDGPMKFELERKAKSLNIDQQVWFYGACYDEKINAELVYNADICVAPGNVGLTAMHTMMFGCPVITHNDFRYQMPEFEAIKPNITGDFFIRGCQRSLNTKIFEWFANNRTRREYIQQQCYNEIDSMWTPYFQMKIIKRVFK